MAAVGVSWPNMTTNESRSDQGQSHAPGVLSSLQGECCWREVRWQPFESTPDVDY